MMKDLNFRGGRNCSRSQTICQKFQIQLSRRHSFGAKIDLEKRYQKLLLVMFQSDIQQGELTPQELNSTPQIFVVDRLLFPIQYKIPSSSPPSIDRLGSFPDTPLN
jgi:hypothetical protein